VTPEGSLCLHREYLLQASKDRGAGPTLWTHELGGRIASDIESGVVRFVEAKLISDLASLSD
jgi:hypothetical protein